MEGGRPEILRRLFLGKVRGHRRSGQRSFSGDGGPALHARLNLAWSSGIAVGRDGTVYFSDTSNGRVRAVGEDGVIETVAGGGSEAPAQRALPALRASLGTSLSVLGLAIGPKGQLYIATAHGIYRLSSDGELRWVVGKSAPSSGRNASGGSAINQEDFLGAQGIAFDGRGDLLVAGCLGYDLCERTASGDLRHVEPFRGNGAAGSLAEEPNGSVVLVAGGRLTRFELSGRMVPFGPRFPIGSPSAVAALLGPKSYFKGGDGVAMDAHGDVYMDTNTGNAATAVSAIVEIAANGHLSAIWK